MPASGHADVLYPRGVDSRDVVIVGAGFSRAVHDTMPDLATLKDRVLEETGLASDPRVPSGAFGRHYTFEDWLSTLSENQPYLSEQENRANTALFAQLRDAIAEVLANCEADASANDPPDWLDPFTRLLHHREATVVTLNYDRLLEAALVRAGLKDLATDDRRPIDDRSAVRDIPPTKLRSPTYRDVGGWTPSRTMRLLKLHGSLDWWMYPDDTTGSTLVREELRLDLDRIPHRPSPDYRSRILTGREVALVPPVLTKGGYVTNLVTRQLWRDAHQALGNATHVAIIGYSLPLGDSMMASLLTSTLRREGVTITVVNLKTSDVAERVGQLTAGPIEEIGGATCVADYVNAYLDRSDAAFRADLVRPSLLNRDPLPIVVTTGSGDHTNLLHRVVKVETIPGDEVILRTVKKGNVMQNAASNEAFDEPSELPTVQDLATALAGASKVVVDLDGTPGRLSRPIRAELSYSATGAAPIATLLLVVPEADPSRLA